MTSPSDTAPPQNFSAVSGSVLRLVGRFECLWCGRRFEMTGRWKGRPQGPQCPCNPNSWGNWIRIDQFKSDDPTYIDGMIRPIAPKPPNMDIPPLPSR